MKHKRKRAVSLLVSRAMLSSMILQANAMAQDLSQQISSQIRSEREKVIYGKDDRLNYDDATEKWQKIADSTAAQISTSSLRKYTDANGDTKYELAFESLQDSFIKACSTERFAQENSQGNCSGFLVGPNTLVTAGHCVNSQYQCDSYSWVFDYKVDSTTGAAPTEYTEDQVFKCKRVLNKAYGFFIDDDYAILELDRPVKGRDALKVRTKGAIAEGDEITVVGYPSGLPVKIAGGAKVRTSKAKDFFVANLDTFGGNSGSSVFNTDGTVEGILVRGETDYVDDFVRGCSVVNKCKDDKCRGEDVTRITNIAELVHKKEYFEAASSGKLAKLQEILDLGVNPYYPNDELKTAIMVAAENARSQVVVALAKLSNGPKIDEKNANGESAVSLMEANEDVATMESLIKEIGVEALSINGSNIKAYAVNAKNAYALKALQNAGVEIAELDLLKLYNAIAGSKEMLESVKRLKLDLSNTSIEQTFVKLAAASAKIEDAKLVVEELGMNIDTQTLAGRAQSTMLDVALASNNDELSAYLVAQGASIDKAHEVDGITYNYVNYAANKGMTNTLNAMLDKGADVNSVSAGQTLIFEVMAHGNLAQTQVLVSRGANLMAKNNENKTAITVAAKAGMQVIVDYALLAAISSNNDEQGSEAVLAKAKITGQYADAGNNIPVLNAATKKQMSKTVSAMLDAAVEVDSIDYINGNTPIYEAVANNDQAMVALLLENKASLKVKNFSAQSPIKYAKELGANKEILKTLRKERNRRFFRGLNIFANNDDE